MNNNRRSLNPNIWDCRNSQPFNNNPSNFFGNNNNNNSVQNFPRPNFNSQQQQIRPLLNFPLPAEHQNSNFRNFNRNNHELFNRNQRGGRGHFSNTQKWPNRKDDSSRSSDINDDPNVAGERSKQDTIESPSNEDPSRPRSLVEHLKSSMKRVQRSNSIDTNESIDNCAKNASRKLMCQLKTMDKDNVKELINNPKQPHRKAVLNIQAREKLREGMRKQLKTLGAEEEHEATPFEAEESVNCESIPETLIAQIGRTVDMDLGIEDMDLQNDIDEPADEDKDMEVVEKNLGNDFLFGSEMLLMNGFSLLGENDAECESDIKIEDTRFPPPPPPLPLESPLLKPPEPISSQVPVDLAAASAAAFTTNANNPWTNINSKTSALAQRFDEEWDLESGKNPDPPNILNKAPVQTQSIQVIVSHHQLQLPPPPPFKMPSEPVLNSNNIKVIKTQENPPIQTVLNLPEKDKQQPSSCTSSNNNNNNNNIIASNKTTIGENKNKELTNEVKKSVMIGGQTPMYQEPERSVMKGGQTPMYQEPTKAAIIGGQTPMYQEPERSVMKGGQTPMYQEPSKAAIIGGQTPMYQEPSTSKTQGGQTPSIQGGQTPSTQNAEEDWDTTSNKTSTSTNTNNNNNNNATNNQSESNERRANETYGDYKRRLANINESFNRPQQNNRSRKDWNNDDDDNNRNIKTPDSNNSWMSNNMRGNNTNNNNNNSDNRKSRFEMNRNDRRKADRRIFDNNQSNKPQNDANDRNNSWDRYDKSEAVDMKDGFNYRFNNKNNNKNSGSHDQDNLSSILNPKPLQFKGSFNKRTGHSNNRGRSNSRERTPTNSSMEREFGDLSSTMAAAANDARPCYYTLKKIMEIDTEIGKVHEKMHGIDKVIANLQSERVGYQKNYSKMLHDRKVLFDNLMKRAMPNESPASERTTSKERPNRTRDEELSTKKTNEPTLAVVEQKKRKIDEPVVVVDEGVKKKKKFAIEEEPKSAAQRQKEKEDEDRRKRIEEIRKQKQLRREREEAEKRRLEEQARKESNDVIPVIKKEPREKSVDKSKTSTSKTQYQPQPSTSKSHKHDKAAKESRCLFKSSDIIQANDYTIKNPNIKFRNVSLAEEIVEQFKSGSFPEVNLDDWKKWTHPTVKVEKQDKEKVKEKEKSPEEIQEIVKTENNNESEKSKGVEQKAKDDGIMECERDPLAMDESEMNVKPPTPGNNLPINENDDSIISTCSDDDNDQDYSEWTGEFEAHEQPIVHLQNIDGKYMVCAAENGKLYKYHLKSGRCDSIFAKHTEICNSFLYNEREKSIYTASSDGYVYCLSYKTFQSTGSKNFNEALQVIEKSRYALYVGAKSGKIFKLKFDLSDDDMEPLCCVDALILCLKAAKEGSRHILIVSSRSNAIQIRDANEGLLLRTLSNDLANVSIYDMLLEGSTIYCGSNLHEIFAIDFTTGALKSKRSMSGAGAICVKLYKDNLIAACYDGNIYIFDVKSNDDAVNIAGPSRMLLSMDLWNDKIIASTKDRTLKIMNIPT